MKLYKIITVVVITIALILLLILLLMHFPKSKSVQSPLPWWKFQSIDTMKYSRDVSREKLTDPAFDMVIDKQIHDIAQTGATHVGIATPYDEEFFPMLTRWIQAARKYNLNIWFRGNWSGWEEWFDYPKITREEHIEKTKEFIIKHEDIFKDGDVFTACPECENGGPGDPRKTLDTAGHREFLINEYKATKEAFKTIGKNVSSNYASMNGDVAKLIMDKPTTRTLDGIVTIDHYVKTPEQLVADIRYIAQVSGGKIILGEFGAPIPNIHGDMTEEAQAEWLKKTLALLTQTHEVIGLNYWTNTGSSTELWNNDGSPRLAIEILTSFYKPKK